MSDASKTSGARLWLRDLALPAFLLLTLAGLAVASIFAIRWYEQVHGTRRRRGPPAWASGLLAEPDEPELLPRNPFNISSNVSYLGIAPSYWLPSRGDECHEHRGVEVCEGPRKVPEPYGEAAKLARKLGLGQRDTASTLLRQGPTAEWLAVVKASRPDPLRWPVPGGKLWSRFGDVRDLGEGESYEHKGLDIGAPERTPILATSDGIVAYADNEVAGYGNLLIVIHPDAMVAMYAHCRAVYAFPGQLLKAGQVVGEVGQTGVTKGPHLHFELRVGGDARDPLFFVQPEP